MIRGIGTARAVRIFKTYGTDAVQVVSENPYRLARDIRGIGFRTADVIAGKLGIEKTAMIRVRAGISYALTEAMSDGHCGLPIKELVALTENLLQVMRRCRPGAVTLRYLRSPPSMSPISTPPSALNKPSRTTQRTLGGRPLPQSAEEPLGIGMPFETDDGVAGIADHDDRAVRPALAPFRVPPCSCSPTTTTVRPTSGWNG